MKSLIRKILFGATAIGEYSKITVPGAIMERVYLEREGDFIDVSQNHWLLCIDPVVFGIWLDEPTMTSDPRGKKYKMYFTSSESKIADIKHKSSARLVLSFHDFIKDKHGMLILLKVQDSKIYHLNFLSRYLLFSRYYKNNGLTFSKFKSFVAAYSYPRQISIVSFRNNSYYNIFPMDLLGGIDKYNRYVLGLRHTNLALPGIMKTGRVTVCEVPFQYKEIIYQLGKHHSSNPPPLESLPFELVRSKSFETYVPAWAENYKEINITETKDLGSHMMLWGMSREKTIVNTPSSHLFLVHFLHYIRQKRNGSTYPLA
jgi:hypothetical protein